MRPIDGDALKEEVTNLTMTITGLRAGKGVLSEVMNEYRKTILRTIDEQPTIEAEPVVHGEWEHLGGDEWCCTECGNVITTEGSWEKPTLKFCDECGAKMDGGSDE